MQLAAGDVRSLVNTATCLIRSSFCSDAYMRPEDFRQPVYICQSHTDNRCSPQRLLTLQDTHISNIKPLQCFSQSMSLSFLIEERQLMFFSKLQRTDNIVMPTLTCVPMVKYEMLGLAAKYGLSDVTEALTTIRDAVQSCFVHRVQLQCFTVFWIRIISLFIIICVFVFNVCLSVCCTLCVFNN